MPRRSRRGVTARSRWSDGPRAMRSEQRTRFGTVVFDAEDKRISAARGRDKRLPRPGRPQRIQGLGDPRGAALRARPVVSLFRRLGVPKAIATTPHAPRRPSATGAHRGMATEDEERPACTRVENWP